MNKLMEEIREEYLQENKMKQKGNGIEIFLKNYISALFILFFRYLFDR